MKVILLGSTPPPVGGIAKWTVRMLNAKLPDQWEVVLVDEKLIGRDVFGGNSSVNYFVEVKRWLRIWSKLITNLFDKQVKVVHSCPIGSTNSMLAESVNAVISKLFRKKVILHFRCTLPNMIKTKRQEKILRFLCKRADMVIALNSQTKQYLDILTKTKTIVLPNFIDETEIISEPIKVNSIIQTALYTGGVIEEKGCLDILEISRHFPEITFRLVGNASMEIKEKSKQYRNVVLTGVKSADEIKSELAAADVYLFLSHFPGEGFSNSLAEAMAAGKPCLVTNWAANADMIEHGLGGFVVECGDNDAAISYLKKMQNQELRTKQAQYNLQKARTQYSQNAVLNEYVKCYNSVINN